MDPSSPTLRASYASMVVNPTIAAGDFDAIYEDNAGPLSEYNSATFSPSLPCGYSDSAWVAADAALEGGAGLPVIFNGLSGLNPYGGYGLSLSLGLFQNSSTIGGDYEHCYTQNSLTSPKYFGLLWQAVENTEIAAAEQGRLFVCNSTDSFAAAGSARQLDEREYAYASFLLTYDLNTSMIWPIYPVGSSLFPINPEEQLVALDPVVSTPLDVAALQLPTGVYGREYNSCYVTGAWVGSCAVVINPDYYNSHAFPYSKYHHTLHLTGSGILDGGTMSVRGAAPPATLPPLGSAIAFP